MTLAKPDSKRKRELTPKELAFIAQITRTDEGRPSSFREALMRVSDTSNQKNQTINNEASRIARRPIVRAEIERINASRERDRVRTAKSSAAAIESALWREVKDGERSADRISALRTLASMLPDTPEKEEDTSLLKKEEIISRIEGIFKEAVGEPIEIEAVVSKAESEVVPIDTSFRSFDYDSSSDEPEVLEVKAVPEPEPDPEPDELKSPAF
tara:strand:+ start:1981 stop:2619 length:639 start_codon:yes stop_codon:yes gene_type:complete